MYILVLIYNNFIKCMCITCVCLTPYRPVLLALVLSREDNILLAYTYWLIYL